MLQSNMFCCAPLEIADMMADDDDDDDDADDGDDDDSLQGARTRTRTRGGCDAKL